MSALKCLVVTPEKTEIDTNAVSVTLPMFDGELGVLKDHSPLVGRLGYGALRIQTEGGQTENHFIEGGFAQVTDNVVSVLTDRVSSLKDVTASSADQELRDALDMPSDSAEEKIARDKACERARALKRVAS